MIVGGALWVGAKMVGSGLLKRAKSIPWQAWVLLGLFVASYLGVQGVRRAINQAEKRGAIAGAKAENERLAKRIREGNARIRKLNGDVLILTGKIRNRTDEQARRIDADHDALLVRGAGKASLARICPAVPAAIGSGPVTANRPGDATVGAVPDRTGLIVLPLAELLGFAKQHDLNRDEVIAHREQRREIERIWPNSNP